MLPAEYRPGRVHEQRFAVKYDYPVIFCENVLATEDPAVAWAIQREEPQRRHPVCVVLDSGLVAADPALPRRLVSYLEGYAPAVELRGEPISLLGGEAAKNDPRIVAELCAAFRERKLDRHAVVLAAGGGAVLDVAGYAAALVHRGVRIVRMPSTVLAQCDGGVGVKNGVNAFGAKNFLGTFAPPFAVVNDFALLRTLSLRDVRAGMAEAVKVALIRDAEFFGWIEAHAEELSRGAPAEVAVLVERAARIHLAHIAEGGDPFELGSQRPLDYGHWAAHHLEIASGHELRHGEAVAIGMLLDARYAERAGHLAPADRARIERVLARLGLPRSHPVLAARHAGTLSVLAGLREFREHLGGDLSVTLLAGIGRTLQVSELHSESVAEAVQWLGAPGEG